MSLSDRQLDTTSTCKKCKRNLLLENFKAIMTQAYGLVYSNICMECDNKISQKVLDRERKSRRKLKIKLINEMGGKCVCCGLTQWWILTIDHIIPIKGKPREIIYTLYRKLLKHPELRKDFQVMCYGCNISKNMYEKCKLDHND